MSDVREVKLPGVGVRHDFDSEAGDTVGVLVHHDGRREILVYDQNDPDACSSIVSLSHDDARTVAELLGATQVTEEVAEAQHAVDEQSLAWITVEPGSRVDGSTIADGRYRTITGASLVAVIRDGQPIPAPEADFEFSGGDMVVAVGDAEALDRLRALLDVVT